MRISVYLPLLASLLFAVGAPVLVRHLAPPLATRTLTAAAALSAAASTWGLALLALTLITRTPPALEHADVVNPVPAATAVIAAVVLVCCLYRGVRTVRVRHRTERDLRGVCALCQPGGELAVLADDTPHTYAVPGRPGRILISTGLLRAADATARRVVLAHERAHLQLHHHRYRAVADLAAALNPLLIPTRTAVAYLVERWADETAAAVIGSRARTARALAQIALATTVSGSPTGLAFHRHAVAARVRALHSPPAESVHILALGWALAAALAATAASDATLGCSRILAPLLGI